MARPLRIKREVLSSDGALIRIDPQPWTPGTYKQYDRVLYNGTEYMLVVASQSYLSSAVGSEIATGIWQSVSLPAGAFLNGVLTVAGAVITDLTVTNLTLAGSFRDNARFVTASDNVLTSDHTLVIGAAAPLALTLPDLNGADVVSGMLFRFVDVLGNAKDNPTAFILQTDNTMRGLDSTWTLNAIWPFFEVEIAVVTDGGEPSGKMYILTRSNYVPELAEEDWNITGATTIESNAASQLTFPLLTGTARSGIITLTSANPTETINLIDIVTGRNPCILFKAATGLVVEFVATDFPLVSASGQIVMNGAANHFLDPLNGGYLLLQQTTLAPFTIWREIARG